MDKLQQPILQNIAQFLSLRELFSSFEPLCKSTKNTVTDLCRQMKTLHLNEYSKMSDNEFIFLMRRCCEVTYLSLDYSQNMINCHQDLWEVNIYCQKLQFVVIHGSPVIASEFGNVNVANLIEMGMKNNLSNQNSNQNMIVSTYHIFVASRIVFLWETCRCDYRIPIFTWGLMKYLLDSSIITPYLDQLSLDHFVIWSFYAICRVFEHNISFQFLLQIYQKYLCQFRLLHESDNKWGDCQKLGFNITFQPPNTEHYLTGDIVFMYNCFFVPLAGNVIEEYRKIISIQQR